MPSLTAVSGSQKLERTRSMCRLRCRDNCVGVNTLMFVALALLIGRSERSFAQSDPPAEAGVVEAADWEVREFVPFASHFDSADGESLWYRYIADWYCIRPGWIVGVIHEGPAQGSVVVPELLAESRHYAAVAISTTDGRAKQVTCDGLIVAIDSLVPLGVDRVGIVTYGGDGWTVRRRCKIREWNLQTDVVGSPRDWHTLTNPVARAVDLESAALDLTVKSDSALPSLLLRKRDAPANRGVEIPLPFKSYETPTRMSSLWEEGRETRWYAAGDDNASVVGFRGVRPSGVWDIDEPLLGESTLTLFDPAEPDGIRWRRTLDEIAGPDADRVVLVAPIRMPWGRHSSLVIDWIDRTGDEILIETVHFAEIRLRDGVVLREAGFLSQPAYPRYFQVSRWPATSADRNRIVFLDESDVISPNHIRVFDLTDQRSLEAIPNSTQDHWEGLVTVLPADEAVIQGATRLWAVGIGEKNYGEIRMLCQLIADEVDP